MKRGGTSHNWRTCVPEIPAVNLLGTKWYNLHLLCFVPKLVRRFVSQQQTFALAGMDGKASFRSGKGALLIVYATNSWPWKKHLLFGLCTFVSQFKSKRHILLFSDLINIVLNSCAYTKEGRKLYERWKNFQYFARMDFPLLKYWNS